MNIAVVIPTYNELDNIGRMIAQILGLHLPGLEIIVVDDNSPDGTGKMLEEIKSENDKVHVIHRSMKMGLGSAYLTGFKLALQKGAEFIIQMDADFSHDPQMIPVLLEEIKNYDIVLGSKYKNGISVINWPVQRLLLSLLAAKYLRIMTGMKLTDIASGFKCIRRHVLESIELDENYSNGYSFLYEMNFRMYRKGFSFGEIPIIFTNRKSGQSKLALSSIVKAVLVMGRLRLELVKNGINSYLSG